MKSNSVWRVELYDRSGNLVDVGPWRKYKGVAQRDWERFAPKVGYMREPHELRIMESAGTPVVPAPREPETTYRLTGGVEDLEWLDAMAARGGLPLKH